MIDTLSCLDPVCCSNCAMLVYLVQIETRDHTNKLGNTSFISVALKLTVYDTNEEMCKYNTQLRPSTTYCYNEVINTH